MDYSVLLIAFAWCSAGLVTDITKGISIDNCNVTSPLDIRENAENNITCRGFDSYLTMKWWIKKLNLEIPFDLATCITTSCTDPQIAQFTAQRSPQKSQLVYRQQNRTEDIGTKIICQTLTRNVLTRPEASCELNVISPANLSSCVVEEDIDNGTLRGICQFDHAFSATRDFTCTWHRTSSSDQSSTEYPGDITKENYTSNGQLYQRGQCSLNISGQQWNDGDYSYSIDFYPGPGPQSVPIGCLGGYYGYKCSKKCGHCKDGAVCNATNGHCLQGCQAGYVGPLCQNSCSGGFYGDKCSEKCGHCKDRAVCDVSNGHCPKGCLTGYVEPLCQNSCPDGFYGDKCSKKCGHCNDGALCDATHGHCPNGCQTGYEGLRCQDNNSPPRNLVSGPFEEQKPDNKSPPIAAITGGAGAGLVVIIGVVVIVVVVLWRRVQGRKPAEPSKTSRDEDCQDGHVSPAYVGSDVANPNQLPISADAWYENQDLGTDISFSASKATDGDGDGYACVGSTRQKARGDHGVAADSRMGTGPNRNARGHRNETATAAAADVVVATEGDGDGYATVGSTHQKARGEHGVAADSRMGVGPNRNGRGPRNETTTAAAAAAEIPGQRTDPKRNGAAPATETYATVEKPRKRNAPQGTEPVQDSAADDPSQAEPERDSSSHLQSSNTAAKPDSTKKPASKPQLPPTTTTNNKTNGTHAATKLSSSANGGYEDPDLLDMDTSHSASKATEDGDGYTTVGFTRQNARAVPKRCVAYDVVDISGQGTGPDRKGAATVTFTVVDTLRKTDAPPRKGPVQDSAAHDYSEAEPERHLYSHLQPSNTAAKPELTEQPALKKDQTPSSANEDVYNRLDLDHELSPKKN